MSGIGQLRERLEAGDLHLQAPGRSRARDVATSSTSSTLRPSNTFAVARCAASSSHRELRFDGVQEQRDSSSSRSGERAP
jgi:hypothetical protein